MADDSHAQQREKTAKPSEHERWMDVCLFDETDKFIKKEIGGETN